MTTVPRSEKKNETKRIEKIITGHTPEQLRDAFEHWSQELQKKGVSIHEVTAVNRHGVKMALIASLFHGMEEYNVPEESIHDVLSFFIAQGASLLEVDSRGQNVLHSACAFGRTSLVKLFLSSVKDPNYINVAGSDQFNPLHLAVFYHQFKVAHLLLDHKADISLELASKKTILHLLAKQKKPEATVLLQRVIDVGGNVDALNKDGETPLKIAFIANQMEHAALLLRSGANPDQLDPEGFSHMHFAVQCRSLPMIKLLSDAGADVLAQKSKRMSPMDELRYSMKSPPIQIEEQVLALMEKLVLHQITHHKTESLEVSRPTKAPSKRI